LGSVNPGRGLQFDTSLQAFEMAAGGAGIALGRSSLLEKELASGRLVLPFADRVPIDEAFHLISPDDGLDHPDAETLRAWLLQEATAAKDPTHPKA
jgi:LysR family transcriptional regulator, glycine cleavage system transcriptional activator